MRVLIVEDDALDAKALRRAAAAIAVPVELELRSSVDEALTYLQQNPAPDLILSDLKLPGTKGCALPALIQSEAGLRGIPVVLLSTSAEPDEVMKSYVQGVAGYFCKPVGSLAWQQLLTTILNYWHEAEHAKQ